MLKQEAPYAIQEDLPNSLLVNDVVSGIFRQQGGCSGTSKHPELKAILSQIVICIFFNYVQHLL